MFDIDGVTINVGRIWTESEGASGREICVVGPDMLKNLLPTRRLTGLSARRSGSTGGLICAWRARAAGSIFGFSRDNVVYIPYSTYQKAYGARRSIVTFYSGADTRAA